MSLEVIDAPKIKPGMAVADLGSGSGYFTRRFVEAVTETEMVYTVDVKPEMLAYAKRNALGPGMSIDLYSFTVLLPMGVSTGATFTSLTVSVTSSLVVITPSVTENVI